MLDLTVALCGELPQIDDVKGFTEGLEALEWFDSNTADIALLDINIPDIDGLTLAQKIKEKHPGTEIIFLTGYSEYALDAFSMHASGYLLKPITRERLENEIEHAVTEIGRRNHPTSRITVQTFGEFDVFVDGKVVRFGRSRSKELLAYLVDRQGTSINRANAFAVLWENGTYDRPMQKQLDVVIRSLKDTLSEYGISEMFEMDKGSMRVVPEHISCDFYRMLDGDREAGKSFKGEYMNSYSWAMETESYLERISANE